MDDKELRQLVADTGRILLNEGLVARTWGNISARKDATKFAISPSGLGYEAMTSDDVPIYDYETETYEGQRKPSSEKKIHAAAYRNFADVNFVIHTHQDYATAVSLVGADKLKLTDEERAILGEIEVADYGLPGTKKLKENVEKAFKNNSKVVLMVHHGAVILGKDRDDALKKAKLLEEVCKRSVDSLVSENAIEAGSLSKEMLSACEGIRVVSSESILKCAELGGFNAQLDDIAQMNGRKLRSVENDDGKILKALNKQDAVLVKGVGCVIFTEEEDDAKALSILSKKACTAYLYTRACNVKIALSAFDCVLMRTVYKLKYSKQKKG